MQYKTKHNVWRRRIWSGVAGISALALVTFLTIGQMTSFVDAQGGPPPPPPPPVIDTTPPATPTGLQATVISTTQINLSWNAATDNVGVTGYKIFRNGTQIATTPTPSYNNTGLTASTSYAYQVVASDAVGNDSPKSSTVTSTTQSRTYDNTDFAQLATDWLQAKTSPADVNSDGKVDARDLGIMMSNWETGVGPPPPPPPPPL